MNPPMFPFGSTPGAGTLPGELLVAQETNPADAALWAVVLAGGIGSRFWPLSSPERPKQLLALVSDRPLIAETIARLQPLIPPERVLVLTSRDIAAPLHAAIPEVPTENMLVEPRPLGTAAALAWAASEIERRTGPETVFCCVHADLAVAFPEAFRHVLREASRLAARDEVLVTVGARPSRPETGFGYIVPDRPLSAHRPMESGGACSVRYYVEKPPRERAEELIRAGALWNTGIFVWRTGVVREALERHAHELAAGFDALEARDLDRFALGVRSISLERGLLERSDRLVVVPADFGWDDVGTWASLRRARELDDTGNGASGRAYFVDASANVVHADGSAVVLYGVTGMLVVTLPGLTFVTTLDRAADLKPLLDALPPDIRGRPGKPSR
ncbi:MAG TPA: sugar phosphate nucleotidyltransferase [Gemmatimonadaceae bacterium]